MPSGALLGCRVREERLSASCRRSGRREAGFLGSCYSAVGRARSGFNFSHIFLRERHMGDSSFILQIKQQSPDDSALLAGYILSFFPRVRIKALRPNSPGFASPVSEIAPGQKTHQHLQKFVPRHFWAVCNLKRRNASSRDCQPKTPRLGLSTTNPPVDVCRDSP